MGRDYWHKPQPAQPVVTKLGDISESALSELSNFLSQFSPQIPGLSVQGTTLSSYLAGGARVADRRGLNFIAGSGASVSMADNPTSDAVDVTITASGGAPGGAAGGDLTGTYPNPTIAADKVDNTKLRNSAALSVIGRSANSTGDPADIAAGADGQVLARASSTLAFALPPGYEINYTQITADVSVTATTAASPTDVVSSGAITYDGTPILIQFFSPRVGAGATAGSGVEIDLWDASTNLGAMTFVDPANATNCVYAVRRITPSAASHTYKIRAWRSVSNGFVNAGPGGSSADWEPAFIRITKV